MLVCLHFRCNDFKEFDKTDQTPELVLIPAALRETRRLSSEMYEMNRVQ